MLDNSGNADAAIKSCTWKSYVADAVDVSQAISLEDGSDRRYVNISYNFGGNKTPKKTIFSDNKLLFNAAKSLFTIDGSIRRAEEDGNDTTVLKSIKEIGSVLKTELVYVYKIELNPGFKFVSYDEDDNVRVVTRRVRDYNKGRSKIEEVQLVKTTMEVVCIGEKDSNSLFEAILSNNEIEKMA